MNLARKLPFWAVIFFGAALVSDSLSAKFLGMFYTAAAAWTVGIWLADSQFERLFRWLMWIRHRRGCGMQTFRVLRREIVHTHRIDFGWMEVEIPIHDLRLQCPKCGRVQQQFLPEKPRAKRRSE